VPEHFTNPTTTATTAVTRSAAAATTNEEDIDRVERAALGDDEILVSISSEGVHPVAESVDRAVVAVTDELADLATGRDRCPDGARDRVADDDDARAAVAAESFRVPRLVPCTTTAGAGVGERIESEVLESGGGSGPVVTARTTAGLPRPAGPF
jgi:hypothetical protein